MSAKSEIKSEYDRRVVREVTYNDIDRNRRLSGRLGTVSALFCRFACKYLRCFK